jgi:hypothetical protein
MKVKSGKDEEASLAKLNEKFTYAMWQRLLEKRAGGWHGWDNKKYMRDYDGGLKERIIQNCLNGEWVDVANLAMFAWNFED